MALCNILGDCGWLGYAFAAQGFVSVPKLIGAAFTMLAHIILLAFGDDQAKIVAAEKGALSRFVLQLRKMAQSATKPLPRSLQKAIRAKPVGIPFSILALNGIGLVYDAAMRLMDNPGAIFMVQAILGVLIILGTCSFAAADFVKSQKTADILTRCAPSILAVASAGTVVLAVLSRNPFIIWAVLVFSISNVAGFYTRIDKEKGQHLHS